MPMCFTSPISSLKKRAGGNLKFHSLLIQARRSSENSGVQIACQFLALNVTFADPKNDGKGNSSLLIMSQQWT